MLLAMPGGAAAQRSSQSAAAEKPTQVVVAGEQYAVPPPGGTLFFGRDYRDLWTTPIRVDVLDMSSTAGGLTPVRIVGGNESRGLALRGADGRDYTFRPVKKDLRDIVPVEFQDSIVVDIIQDQAFRSSSRRSRARSACWRSTRPR
jgi:hypothetical protein